jgi:GNAT superfamily N-acetyltransferase
LRTLEPVGSDVIVRDARADEIGTIAGVLSASYEQYMPAPDAQLTDLERVAWDAYRVDIADVSSRAVDSDQIVAEIGGRVLGAVTFYPPAREAHYPSQTPVEHWPMEWASFRLLGVHPDARGRGIGRILTDECVRRARDLRAPVLALHTTLLMDIARDMYVKMGWKRAAEYDFFPMPDFTVEAYTLDL